MQTFEESYGRELVLAGRDGYLFLQNDSNRVTEQVEGRYPLGDATLWGIGAVHASRALFGRVAGYKYGHVIVPNKETVLEALLPPTVTPRAFGPTPVERYLAIGCGQLNAPFFHPGLLLEEHRSRSVYLRQDTHWTWWGAFVYMVAALAATDPALAGLFASVPVEKIAFELPGDLGEKIGLRAEPAVIGMPKSPKARLVYDNGLEYHGRMRVFSAEGDLPRAVFMHDSFLEFVIPQLAECFSKVLFAQTPEMDFEMVRQFRPQYVIVQQAERFFVRVPPPSSDWRQVVAQARGGGAIKPRELPEALGIGGGIAAPQ